MGRRRRRIVKIVKKRLPTVFDCPACSENSIKITINKNSGKTLIQCAACGLKEELESTKSSEPIDIYCLFTDRFYKLAKSTQ